MALTGKTDPDHWRRRLHRLAPRRAAARRQRSRRLRQPPSQRAAVRASRRPPAAALHQGRRARLRRDATRRGRLPDRDSLRRHRRRLHRRPQRHPHDGGEPAGDQPGGQGGASTWASNDSSSSRPARSTGRSFTRARKTTCDDRPGRREPLGLRRQQARLRAPVLRALQGGQAAARDRAAVQRLRPAAGRRRRHARHGHPGAAEPADHALQRRHADSLVVLHQRLRRRRAALRRAARGGRPRLQSRQPAGHRHELRAGEHDHPAGELEVGDRVQAASRSGSGPARAVDRKGDVAARLPARTCRSSPASGRRSSGTRGIST